QIGLPQLPQVASSSYFEIMRQWLIDCDHNHPKCRRSSARDLPTRLIYVGTLVNPSLSLYETQPRDNMRYSALSHPWGKPPHFCTFPSTIDNHKKGIDFYDLPLTFRNAITVTRELNLQYLWIDSICIIQGPDGDFENEATRMEAVFSNAYCVLAACSVLGQGDSFLNERKKRKNISLKYEGKPAIFVCEFMDNFNQDVLESNLSQRGWVLQERALARRTIYFTDKQTYWECGGGVRCETMARMDNTLASFLGDPNFPKVAIESSRGGKILFHQSLCKQYSRLAFTRQTDRPVAISGLEKRLVQSFGVSGGYGVLNDTKNPGMLRRSMLWHRASDCTTLRRISFARSAPPTWSCMSYEGPIDYPDLPFAQVEWEQCDIQSQFLESGT
ncbi:HET-domain-containing protein, partial [Cryphonectria parasitica EP155]